MMRDTYEEAMDVDGIFPRETDGVKLIDIAAGSSSTTTAAHERRSSGELPSGFVFEQRSTICGAFFNFVNSIVGAGIVGMLLQLLAV